LAEQAYAYVTLIPVAKGFQREVAKQLDGVGGPSGTAGQSAGKSFSDGFGSQISGLVRTVGTALAAIGVASFIKDSVNAASAFYAEFEGVNQIFGEAAPRVQEFADQAARLVGLSETAALQASKNFGVFATSAGLSGKAAADFSVDLVKAAGDLASFNDVPIEDTLAAIRSGLQGQGEPLSRFGILMNEGLLRTKAFEEGITDNINNALTPQERVLAANALILDELGVAQGDFVNYADTYGNAIKTIQATFADLTAEIGLALMPAVENMTVAFRNSLTQIQDPTTALGESWNELIGTVEAFGATFERVFGGIDAADVLEGILDVVQMLVNGFSQIIYIGGDAADIIGKIFSGDFAGAGQQASTFFSRYNKFVEGLYDRADDAARVAQARAAASGFGPMTESGGTLDFLQSLGFGGVAQAAASGRLPKTGTTKTAKDMTDQARKLIKDTREAFKSARSDYAKRVEEIQTDFAERQDKIGQRYNSTVEKATKRFNQQSVDIIKTYDNAVLQANRRRDDGLAKALSAHNKRIADINKEFAQRQADIIQQSMDRLRNAYRSAVEVNVASIFDSARIAGSVDGLVQTLRDKLIASRQLVENAARLSSEGFSQTFIEQVVGAGTEVGNELAEAILNSTPETVNELKMLYGAIEKQSETGLDALSQQIFEQTGLATTELRNLYAATERELIESLTAQNAAYAETVASINAEFNESLVRAEVARDEALTRAQEALDESILEAKIARDEALQETEETLRKALLRAAERFNSDIERIEKIFKDKIASMRGAISGLSAQIAGVNSALNQAQARVQATASKLATPKLTPFAEGGLVTGPTAALIGEAGPEVVIPLDRFDSMMGMGQPAVNYYAAPNQSLDSEQELFQAMKRAKVVVGW
jgi:hypothetical protein